MAKPNYERKARVLATDLPTIEKQTSFALFVADMGLNIKTKYDVVTAENLRSFYLLRYPDEWHEAIRINKANYERTTRCFKRTIQILEKPSLFLTLTFNETTMQKTSAETRRYYVNDFLRSLNVPYIANVDYGAKNGREHYHALVQIDYIDYSLWHMYGAIKGERIRLTYDINGKCVDATRLSKYINKLTNHAIKATTKRCCIMYSRETRWIDKVDNQP